MGIAMYLAMSITQSLARASALTGPCTYCRANGRLSLTSSTQPRVGVTCPHAFFSGALMKQLPLERSAEKAWLCEAVLSAIARIETRD